EEVVVAGARARDDDVRRSPGAIVIRQDGDGPTLDLFAAAPSTQRDRHMVAECRPVGMSGDLAARDRDQASVGTDRRAGIRIDQRQLSRGGDQQHLAVGGERRPGRRALAAGAAGYDPLALGNRYLPELLAAVTDRETLAIAGEGVTRATGI